MADFFTGHQIDRLTSTTVRVATVCRFDFTSSTKFAWNGNTKLTVDDITYLPMFGYGSIDGLEYDGDGSQSQATTLTLNGLPDQALDVLAAVLADSAEVDQQLVTISFVLFDADWQPIGSALPVFYGFMQPPKVSRSEMQDAAGAIQTITITAENAFFNRSRPAHGRYTDRDQQARSPGDKFFDFVSELLNKTLRYPDY